MASDPLAPGWQPEPVLQLRFWTDPPDLQQQQHDSFLSASRHQGCREPVPQLLLPLHRASQAQRGKHSAAHSADGKAELEGSPTAGSLDAGRPVVWVLVLFYSVSIIGETEAQRGVCACARPSTRRKRSGIKPTTSCSSRLDTWPGPPLTPFDQSTSCFTDSPQAQASGHEPWWRVNFPALVCPSKQWPHGCGLQAAPMPLQAPGPSLPSRPDGGRLHGITRAL